MPFSLSRPQPAPAASIHAFALPELLPAHTRLLLDTHTHTAIFVHLEQTELAASHSLQLTPSAARLFFALLQAYPHCCPYRSLFLAIYPGHEHAGDPPLQSPIALRPIRRALTALTPVLRGVGLQVVSLRGQGYVLTGKDASPDPTKSSEKSVTTSPPFG